MSRRDFLANAALAAAALNVPGVGSAAAAENAFNPPVALFSKIYQELKLDFDQAADLTAEAGLDGLDIPVRPGGEIVPERAADGLPRYAEALRKRQKRVLLLTTAILSPKSPSAEPVLRAAKQVGVRYYRLGFVQVPKDADASKQLTELRAGLKELAALNKELGLTAVFQNHSSGGKNRYLGGDLAELYQVVQGFNPDQIGLAFDLGHAIIMNGESWPRHFDKLKPYVKVAYVKDVSRNNRFVRFGEGEFSKTNWFTQLKTMGYNAPFSLHIEFDWTGPDKAKTREALRKALAESATALRDWAAKA